MSRASLTRAGACLIALFTLGVLSERSAGAQAWVDPGGSLSASLDYLFSPSQAIVENPDDEFDGEPITAHIVSLGVDYAPIERLGLSAVLPMVAIKYGGDGNPFMRHGDYDDGDYHTTLTDLRFNARYQLLEEIVAFAPHVGVSIPVADYENVGFANAGRGLKQLHLGASVGRTIDPVLPNLFFHVTYEYSLVEKYTDTANDAEADVTDNVGENHSDLAALLGYFFLDGALRIDAGFNWRIHHGGINFTDFTEGGFPATDPRFTYHDPLLNEEFMLIGADLGYELTDRITLEATTRFFLRGYNTRDANTFGLGLTFDIL
jgi:hypothetical protein